MGLLLVAKQNPMALTPALSHPMGEGETVPTLAEIHVVGFARYTCKSKDVSSLFPLPF